MAIFLIILLGLILRVISLNQSLWLDEAISAIAARDFSYSGIIFDFLKIDNHPPLFYLALKLWGQIFGFVDTNLRILSVLLGLAVIPTVYKISLNLLRDKRRSLAAAFLTAASPLLIYYSHEVRMYMLITFLTSLQILIFSEILKKEAIWKWILFSAVSCLLFFSDYITIFLFPVFLIYPLIFKKARLLKRVLLSLVPLFILFVFWYPFFSRQLAINKNLIDIFPGWKEIIGGATFKNLAVFWMKIVLGRISFEPKILYYTLVAVFSIPLLAGLHSAFKDRMKNMLLILWFLIPVVLGFSVSFIIPVFNYFRFIYVVPALLILTTIGIFKYSTTVRYIILAAVVLGNIIGLSIYYLDPSQQRENWKQVVDFIEKAAGENDLIVFEFHEPFAPYRFYSSNKIDAIGATDYYFADKIKTEQKLKLNLEGKNGVYYFEYLRDLSDPQRFVEQTIGAEGFKKGKIFNNFYNIGQVSFWSR